MKKIKVVIVDDSKLIQSILSELLLSDPRFDVVGIADNPHHAREVIKQTDPDVITLDVEMPKMNGITFLRNLMRLRPTPVVMISTLTAEGGRVTLEALELGAIDFVEKPADLASNVAQYRDEICEKIFSASMVSKLKLLELQQRLLQNQSDTADQVNQVVERKLSSEKTGKIKSHRIVAIGGSTGGLEALSSLLRGVSFCGKECIVVCLHLPAGFTASYAKRLDSLLPVSVAEATDRELLVQGRIYIAPGGLHMEVVQHHGAFYTRITDNEPVNRHKPSVDVLFDSVAEQVGSSAMGMILTGMGKDGAEGLKKMAIRGCDTYAQDEATSVVWGMPGAAFANGAVSEQCVLPLSQLSQRLSAYYRR